MCCIPVAYLYIGIGMCTNLKMNVRRNKWRSSVKATQPIAVIVNVVICFFFFSMPFYSFHAYIGCSWCKCIFCWYFHWSFVAFVLIPKDIRCCFLSSFLFTFFFRPFLFKITEQMPNWVYRWVHVRCMCLTKQSSGLQYCLCTCVAIVSIIPFQCNGYTL